MPMRRKEGGGTDAVKKEKQGLVSTLLWVGGVLCAWAAIELAFKPLLHKGRKAIKKSLDPDYDVDDELDINDKGEDTSSYKSDKGNGQVKDPGAGDDLPS
ncbi:hypothetical protein KP509_1Z096900 [Ceratopteris richardii]|nr:hypothetical protein KP509_1Z096900 [Ceratopteris richardii]